MNDDSFEIRRYNELKMVSAELYDQIKKGYGKHIDNLSWFLEFMDEMFPDLTGGDNGQIHRAAPIPRGAVHSQRR